MKYLTTGLCIGMLTAALCVPVSAENLVHLEASEGIIDVVGYEVITEGGKNVLCVIADYENTTEESCMPIMQYTITAFQDGIELENAYTLYEPEGCKDSTLEIRPGAKIRYSSQYELTGDTPVEIEVAPLFDFDNTAEVYTIDLSQSISPEDSDEPDYKAMYEELKAQYDELEEKYNALVNQ